VADHGDAIAPSTLPAVEKFLDGPDISLFVVTDDVTAVRVKLSRTKQRGWATSDRSRAA
jgi:hypothetical protein